jgi:hypothetical protein
MTKKLPTFAAGDRVAYAAKFLKNTGQFTGNAGFRRGTFVQVEPRLPSHGRVRWDDFEAGAAAYAKSYGEDYVEDARANGQLVALSNIAKVGSARFACNDL